MSTVGRLEYKNMKPLRFTTDMLTKKPPNGFDVETTLAHFAIITYMVDPAVLRPHLHPRFELDCILAPDGTEKALLSIVPFIDQDFRFVRLPFAKWRFGQTNYRVYATDTQTGEHIVWFLGTVLDSVTVNIPRHMWKLPWHKAKIGFDVAYDAANGRYSNGTNGRYTTYRMTTQSQWAPATLELEDSGQPIQALPGFPDLETGLVLLTHPLRGYYYRRNGTLGGYTIWHDKLQLTQGQVITAHFPLLDRLGLVKNGGLTAQRPTVVHSVLIQPQTEFTIYLPPTAVVDRLT